MKTINDYRKEYTAYDVGYQMDKSFRAGYFCARFEKEINQFNELPDTNSYVTVDGEGVHLNRGSRADVLGFIKIFGGRWNKTPNKYNPEKIDYRQEVETPFTTEHSKFLIEASQAEPPPSCVIEEYEELVPERMVKKKRMVCPKLDGDEAEQLVEITREIEVVQ